MKNHLLIFALFLLISPYLSSQNISFSDLKLKDYLIVKNCVDTNNDGEYDADVDTNDDNEIQLTEAKNVLDLKIGNYPDTFFIKSFEDLRHFDQLKRLTVLYQDSLYEISNLGMDSLAFLWIGSSRGLKHIDISDLPNIQDLRIEDLDGMDYLNLKNGSFPSGIFSLFYTENIQEACVDSIAAEYNEVAWHMAPEGVLDTTCENSTAINEIELVDIQLFPNPTAGELFLKTSLKIKSVTIFDMAGRAYIHRVNPGKMLDLTNLPAGIYMIQLFFDDRVFTSRLLKK